MVDVEVEEVGLGGQPVHVGRPHDDVIDDLVLQVPDGVVAVVGQPAPQGGDRDSDLAPPSTHQVRYSGLEQEVYKG